MPKKPTPETYRDLKIIKSSVRIAAGKMPQLITRLKCNVGGAVLESDSWRDLELQIDEQLDKLPYNGRMSEGRKTNFAQGDTVRITVGVFANLKGRIDNLDAANGRAQVILLIHGRTTLVELECDELERIADEELEITDIDPRS